MAKWFECLNSMRIAAIALFIIGIVLSGVGMTMRAKQNAFTVYEEEVVKGNRTPLAVAGGAAGAVMGGGAAAAIGGVGVAACGTGIGIPVGALCLGCAAILGVVGAGTASLFGTPDKVVGKEITNLVAAYSPWEYWTVICIGAILVAVGMWLFFKARNSNKTKEDTPLPLSE